MLIEYPRPFFNFNGITVNYIGGEAGFQGGVIELTLSWPGLKVSPGALRYLQ
jgi:hypothetical protein